MARTTTISLLTLATLLAGCASATTPQTAPAKLTFGEREQFRWDQLNRIKANYAWRSHDVQVFDFPGSGRIIVRAWFLEGGPGWEYIRAKFTYENTTGEPVDRVQVVFTVLDPQGQPVADSKLLLVHPLGYSLAPGAFYSDEIQAPTLGAHLQGVRWSFDCVAEDDWPAVGVQTK